MGGGPGAGRWAGTRGATQARRITAGPHGRRRHAGLRPTPRFSDDPNSPARRGGSSPRHLRGQGPHGYLGPAPVRGRAWDPAPDRPTSASTGPETRFETLPVRLIRNPRSPAATRHRAPGGPVPATARRALPSLVGAEGAPGAPRASTPVRRRPASPGGVGFPA